MPDAGEIGSGAHLRRLDQSLAQGLRRIQVREKAMPAAEFSRFAEAVIAKARAHGAPVMSNTDIELARRLGADGVHLNSIQLARMEQRPALPWCAASCHNALELARAARLGVDFAVLGPVQATTTHPDAQGLEWDGVRALLQGPTCPLLALAGRATSDLATDRRHGPRGPATPPGGGYTRGGGPKAGAARRGSSVSTSRQRVSQRMGLVGARTAAEAVWLLRDELTR